MLITLRYSARIGSLAAIDALAVPLPESVPGSVCGRRWHSWEFAVVRSQTVFVARSARFQARSIGTEVRDAVVVAAGGALVRSVQLLALLLGLLSKKCGAKLRIV